MTNERAIDLLKNILPEKVSFASLIGVSGNMMDEMVYEGPEPYAVEYAIEAIKENEILKSEIDQLKTRLEIKDNNFELYSDALDKIEQLKAELSQSVKLPCKIGDTVYCVDFDNNEIDESIVNDVTYHVGKEEFSFDSDLLYFWSEDIGDCVFLTREEAEQTLKEKE